MFRDTPISIHKIDFKLWFTHRISRSWRCSRGNIRSIYTSRTLVTCQVGGSQFSSTIRWQRIVSFRKCCTTGTIHKLRNALRQISKVPPSGERRGQRSERHVFCKAPEEEPRLSFKHLAFRSLTATLSAWWDFRYLTHSVRVNVGVGTPRGSHGGEGGSKPYIESQQLFNSTKIWQNFGVERQERPHPFL